MVCRVVVLAVGPDQCHSLVGLNLQGDAVHRRDSAVADHQILYLQHQTALPRYAWMTLGSLRISSGTPWAMISPVAMA